MSAGGRIADRTRRNTLRTTMEVTRGFPEARIGESATAAAADSANNLVVLGKFVGHAGAWISVEILDRRFSLFRCLLCAEEWQDLEAHWLSPYCDCSVPRPPLGSSRVGFGGLGESAAESNSTQRIA